MPARDELIRILEYDPFSGELRWKVNDRHRRRGNIATRKSGKRLVINWNKQRMPAERVAWRMMTGNNWKGHHIRHKNHDTRDIRWRNLHAVCTTGPGPEEKARLEWFGNPGSVWEVVQDSWDGERIHHGYFADKKTAGKKVVEVNQGLKTIRASVTSHSDRPHAERSPSSLAGREACPGFDPDNSRSPDELDSVTISGTRLHETMEDPSLVCGLDEEEMELYKWTSSKAKLNSDLFTQGAGTVDIVDEPRLTTHLPLIWGYPDRVIIADKRALLKDWKFGYWKQTAAAHNPQFLAYALGTFFRWDVEMVRVEAYYARFREVDTHTYLREDIPTMMVRLSAINARIEANNARIDKVLNPDPGTCYFCGNMGDCPAMHKALLPLSKTTRELPALTNPLAMENATPEDAGEAVAVADLLEKVAIKYRRRLRDDVVDVLTEYPDCSIYGYHMVNQHRIEATGINRIIESASHYLSEEQIKPHLKVSLGDLAKAVGRTAPRGQQGKLAENFRDTLLEEGAAKLTGPFTFLKKTPTTTKKEKPTKELNESAAKETS
jgi:hypothetical protein